MKQQSGLSLVELMIAVTLGLILMTGVIQIFVSSKAVFTTHHAVSRIQETGRLAMEFLSKDIRMAGYMGCASRSASMKVTNTLKNSANFNYDFSTAVIGYSQSTVPAGVLTPDPTKDTDIVVIRSAGGSGVNVTQNNNGGQLFASYTGIEEKACSNGVDNKISGICDGDILVVTDCEKARIFQATHIVKSNNEVNITHTSSGNPGNAIVSWGGSSAPDDEVFEPGSEIIVATNTAYFIATGVSQRPSLWQSINGTALELLEGVEDMAISYGVDTDANFDYVPNHYVKANAVTDWDRVVSVQVDLLVASVEDNVLPETQVYSFDGENNKNPGDRRLRQVFTSTIGIRSRLY